MPYIPPDYTAAVCTFIKNKNKNETKNPIPAILVCYHQVVVVYLPKESDLLGIGIHLSLS